MSTMMSTSNIVVLTPTPITDPLIADLAMIKEGSELLDLDMHNNQHHSPRYVDSPSPLTAYSYSSPSPDMHFTSFYPEPTYPQQTTGPSIDEFGETDMVRLLMREMIPEILADCEKLNLRPNIYQWSPSDVQQWILCIMNRFELTEVDLQNFYVDGFTLSQMQDADFRQRAPKCGDVLFSIVYILKQALQDQIQPQVVPDIQMQMAPQGQELSHIPTTIPTPFNMQGYPATPVSPGTSAHDCESGSTGSPSDDESSIPSPAPSGPNTSMTPNHTGGIQLWQFLKELLLQPNSYSYCIRWLDRSQGIFKIEDSVEVARLWGLRKNRPAMNYDKLSRSIRQYYRKGIMKKTEVSQRLVYQFVHPC